MEQSAVISTLNTLIEACQDGHAGYQVAAHGVTSMDVKRELGHLAKERRQFEEELRAHIERLGGKPRERGTVTGALHRGWMQLKEQFGHPTPADMLRECTRGEVACIRDYSEALAKGLPDDVRSVVSQQLGRINAARDRLLEMGREGE